MTCRWTGPAVALVAVAALFAAAPPDPASAAAPEICPAPPRPTIVGTPGDDHLVGTEGPDVIDGGGGHDVIEGRGGRDVLIGGPGRDTLYGGDERYIVLGGADGDVLVGGPEQDRLCGGPGEDTILGGSGVDTIAGGDAADLVSGGTGWDVIDGDGGDDVLAGGVGDDTIRGGLGSDRIGGGTEDDTILGGPGDDRIDGNAGTDTADGDDGRDTCVAETVARCEAPLVRTGPTVSLTRPVDGPEPGTVVVSWSASSAAGVRLVELVDENTDLLAFRQPGVPAASGTFTLPRSQLAGGGAFAVLRLVATDGDGQQLPTRRWAVDCTPTGPDLPHDGIDQDCDGADRVIDGPLRVELAWTNDDNLDLRVTEPDGTVISRDHPGPTASGGRLLRDDNTAGCGKDPHEGGDEVVVWPTGSVPQVGTYSVDVEVTEACGSPLLGFVGAFREDQLGLFWQPQTTPFTFTYPLVLDIGES
jgi:hypothetical protein